MVRFAEKILFLAQRVSIQVDHFRFEIFKSNSVEFDQIKLHKWTRPKCQNK